MRLFSLFALACACLSAQPSGARFYTVEKELALGRQLADDARKQTVRLEDAEVQDYANRIARRLSAHVESPFPWSFEVVAGLMGNPTHEPLALPGGFLFIPSELVLSARDEDEFAGMLAHSIAHVVNRDLTRSAASSGSTNYGTVPLIFIGGWQNALAFPTAYLPTARTLEAAADAAAVGIMKSAGYDPRALVRYIARVQPETLPGRSPFPQRAARITALNDAIQALSANDFAKMQQRVRGEVGERFTRKVPSLYP